MGSMVDTRIKLFLTRKLDRYPELQGSVSEVLSDLDGARHEARSDETYRPVTTVIRPMHQLAI